MRSPLTVTPTPENCQQQGSKLRQCDSATVRYCDSNCLSKSDILYRTITNIYHDHFYPDLGVKIHLCSESLTWPDFPTRLSRKANKRAILYQSRQFSA